MLNKLEAAIFNTDLSAVRKQTYKSVLIYCDGHILISRGMKELLPTFFRKEDINKIKEELRKIESEEKNNVTQN